MSTIDYPGHIVAVEMAGSLSGTLATVGPTVPYLIGAKWNHADRRGIAFVGDGAMQMNNMAEPITVAKYWQQWTDPRLIVAVLHNDDLNQVTWKLRAMGDSPKFVASQSLPDADYAAFARSLGLHGENGARRAVRPRYPADPLHATYAQAKSVVTAVLKADEYSTGFIKH